ncbi:MAG: DUF4422 domain-containing protein [Lachnospiraceae bacterium]|nr:DUF4422 domain-containing protein [Lachnospiraceae bacterium]
MGEMMTDKKRALIGERDRVVIYGAAMVAVSVYYAVKSLYTGCRIEAFLVSSRDGNPAEIDGIPVKTLEEWEETDCRVLVAVPEEHHEVITAALKERRMTDYVCIDAGTEAALMEEYYRQKGIFSSLRSYEGHRDETFSLAVYMSCFHKDKKLKKRYYMPEWVRPIQAGAALTDDRIADICDNTGENISFKNKNYSELSALYWVGKHGTADYLGLYHYRRVLDVTEEDLGRIQANGIDAVLPFPTVHYPDILEHHGRYLKETDWEAMVRALQELSPAYAEALPEIFSGVYFYNYNMLIARRPVFQAYCDWLFPILARTEELSDPKGSERADRYIGYIGENLTTLYFLYHKSDLHIAHTGRRMLI